MRVHVVRPNELSAADLATWSAIQAASNDLDSPLFSPQFSQLVGSVRSDAEIALLEEAGRIAGFLPYHRTDGNVGRPIGLRLCDFQGAIVEPALIWKADDVVRQCGLAAWHFDHLIASQTSFRAFHWSLCSSPFMDVSQGFEAYCAERRQAGKSQLIAQIQRKARKVQRELGPLRFTPYSQDQGDLHQLIAWKTQQHQMTRVMEVFRIPWVRDLATAVWSTRGSQFDGMLSTLHAGDQLLAVHLGMRSASAWHLWFPTFNREFAPYSPGLILLLEMARMARALGIRRIDLGKGPERYKVSLMSGARRLAEGSVDARPVMRSLRRGWHEIKHWIRDSRLSPSLTAPLRWTRRFRQQLAFR